MGENDVQSLFNFLSGEGYDLGSLDKFKSALSDNNSRKQVYDFFTSEGFDMGDYDKFVVTPSSNVPSFLQTGQREAIPQGIAAPKPTQAQRQAAVQETVKGFYSMEPPNLADLRAEEDKRNEPQYFTGTQAEQFKADPRAYYVDQARQQGLTSKEMTLTPNDPTPAVQAISTRIGIPQNLSKYTDQAMQNDPNLASRFQRDENVTEREVAGLIGNGIARYGTELAKDIQALQRSLDPMEAEAAVSTLAAGGDMSQFDQRTQDYANKYMEYSQAMNDMATYMDRFPGERQRLADIRKEIESNRPSPDDTFLTKVGKQAYNAARVAKDRVLQTAGSWLTTARGLSESILEVQGYDTGQYDFADAASENISNWYDDNVRSYIDTQVIKDGKFQAENLIPAVAGTATDMALLLGAGSVAGKAMGSANAGLVASGYASTFGDFYNAAVEKGLEPSEALSYAHGSAFVQGLLESVSPNTLITRNVAGSFRGALNAVASGAITGKDVVRTVLKEIGEENIQELVQGLSEKAINAAANQAFGTDFSDTMSKDEVMETAILTTATAGLLTSIRAKGTLQAERDASLQILRDRKDEFEQWLKSEYAVGNITREEATQASQLVANEQVRQAQEVITPTENAPDEQRMAQALVEETLPELTELEAALDAIEQEQAQQATTEPTAVTPTEPEPNAEPTVEPTRPSPDEPVDTVKPVDVAEPTQEPTEARRVQMRPSLTTVREEPEAKVRPIRKSNLRVIRDRALAPAQPVEPTEPKTRQRKVATAAPVEPTTPAIPAVEPVVEPVAESPVGATPEAPAKPEATFSVKGKGGPFVFEGTKEEVELVKIGNAQRSGRKVDETRKAQLEDKLGKTATQAFNEVKRKADKVEPAVEPVVDTPIEVPTTSGPGVASTSPTQTGPLPDEVFNATDPSELSEIPKKDIQVGSFVEYDGGIWYVTKKEGNGFALTSNNRRGRAKGVTPAEITRAFTRNVPEAQSGDQIIWDGKVAKVAVGENITIDFGDKKKVLPLNEKNLKEVADGKSSYKRKEKLDKARVALKKAADELFRLNAVYDPKSQAESQVRLVRALEAYIAAWISHNGSLAYSRFKKSLPSRLVIPDDELRKLFEGSEAYKKMADQQAENKERQFDAALGNQESAGAKNFIEKSNLDQKVKDEIKRKGLNYFAEARTVTDATAKLFIAEVGIEEAVDTFLNKKGLLPQHVEMFIARNLIAELNAAGNHADAAKVALEMVYRGREAGRALNAFVGLSLLTPEGLQIFTTKFIEETKERLKPRYQRRTDRIMRKYVRAQQEAAQITFQSITDIARREEIKAGLKQAGQELREVTSNLSSGGILNPRVWVKFIQYGKYLILDGALEFSTWAKRFQQAHDITEAQLQDLWNTKIDGKQTLADLASGRVVAEIQPFLRDRDKLEQALSAIGIYDSTRLAKDLHDKYRRNLASQFKKMATKAEQIALQVIESGSEVEADALKERMLANDGFVAFDEDIEKKLAEVGVILTKSPVSRQKEVAVAELMQLVFQKMGKVAYGEYYMFMLYANMLFGVDTHLTNVIAGGLQAGSDIAYGSILRPFTEGTKQYWVEGINDPLVTYQGSGRKLAVARETARAARFGAKRGAEVAKDIVKRGRSVQLDEGKYPIPDLGERARSFKEAFAKLKQVQDHLAKGEVKQAARALFSGLFGTYANINKYSLRALTAEDMLIRTPVMFAYMVRASEYLAGLEVAGRTRMYLDTLDDMGIKDPTPSQREEVQARIADELRGWKAGEMETRWSAKLQEVREAYEQSGVPITEDVRPRAIRRLVDERISDVLYEAELLPKRIVNEAIENVAEGVTLENYPDLDEKITYLKSLTPEELRAALGTSRVEFETTIRELSRPFFDGPTNENADAKKERQDDLKTKLEKKLTELSRTDFAGNEGIKAAYDEIFQDERDSNTTANVPYTEADVFAGAMERFPQDFRVYDIALKKATRSVFNNPPEGILGIMANFLNSLSSSLPVARVVVPFTNLLANVLNVALDYNPLIGIPRLLDASPSALINSFFGKDNPTTTVKGGGAWKRDLDEQIERRYELLTRMMVGLVAGTLAAMLLAGEDEEGFPLLTGQGPKDWRKAKKWKETHKPFSMRIGDTYVSYQNWPVSTVLAFFGNYFDIQRYGSDKQKQNAMVQAMAGYVPFVLNNSFMSGLSKMYTTINDLAAKAMKGEEFAAGTLGSNVGQMVPFANLAMDLDKGFNETEPWLPGWQKFYARIPFVRHVGTRPMLDQFGEPLDTKAYDNKAANALYKGLGGERFFSPPKKLTDLEKLFVKYNYITPEIKPTDDPYLDYDLNMITRKVFARAAGMVTGEFTEKDFEDRMDRLFQMAKAQVVASYKGGKDTARVLKEMNVKPSY